MIILKTSKLLFIQSPYAQATVPIPKNQAEYVAHLVAASSTGTYSVLSAYNHI